MNGEVLAAVDAYPFEIDPEERADAERFWKEQEKLQERHRRKLAYVSSSAPCLNFSNACARIYRALFSANQTASMLTADSLEASASRLRSDSDSSAGDAEKPSPACAISYETVS